MLSSQVRQTTYQVMLARIWPPGQKKFALFSTWLSEARPEILHPVYGFPVQEGCREAGESAMEMAVGFESQ